MRTVTVILVDQDNVEIARGEIEYEKIAASTIVERHRRKYIYCKYDVKTRTCVFRESTHQPYIITEF